MNLTQTPCGASSAASPRARCPALRRAPRRAPHRPGRARLDIGGAIVVACTLLAGPALRTAHAGDTVLVGGTGSGTGGMRLLAHAFTAATPGGASIDVQPAVGSAGGIGAVIDGRLDVAISNRMPNEKELAQAGLVSIEYARTPFVVALHKNLKVSELTSAQLAGLYAPGIVNLPGGQRARAVLRLSDAGDTKLLKSFSPAVSAAVDEASARPGMLNANTDSEAADMIEKTPGAFAVSTLALIESESRPLMAVAIDGKRPSVANLANGSYPYFKSLYLIVGPKASADTRAFAAYVRSEPARKLLSSNGHWVR